MVNNDYKCLGSGKVHLAGMFRALYIYFFFFLRVVVAKVLNIPWMWEHAPGGVHEPVGPWLEDFDYPVWAFPSLVESHGC